MGTQSVGAFEEMSERKQAAAEASEIYHRLIDRFMTERLQLAQKLHNGPIQELQGLNFALTALAHAAEVNPKLGDELSQLRVTIQQIARQLRDIQNDLDPPTLTAFGLAAAIQSYVKILQNSNPTLTIQLNLAVDGRRLPQPVRAALFYACKQALTNVIQHAAAQQVQVQLTLAPAFVQLAVIDDGCGFEVPAHWITIVRDGCLGLAGVMERTEAIEGHCQIRSTPGKGTALCVTAPLPFHAS